MPLITHIHNSATLAAIMFITFYAVMLFFSRLLQFNRSVLTNTTRPGGRYGALDGLRGVLAYGVMSHHAVTSYIYFTTGVWEWSNNATLNQLGQSTVALFFMITGFLFTEKCTAPSVNWRNLYVSRFSRLVPLYAVVILVLFTVVMALSDFELNVPRLEFVKELAQWLEHFQVRCIVVPGETLRQTDDGQIVWRRSASQVA